MTIAKRKRLRRAALPPADFAAEETLLQEAARLTRAVAAFRARPAAVHPPGQRKALMDELTQLLLRLKTAQAAVGEKLRRGARAAGAMNAYARIGGMMKRR